MRATLLAVTLLALPAMAGERLLGTIVSAAGADTTNATTAAPFFVPPAAKLTIVCNATAYVITDVTTAASSTTAVPLSASEKFPTSTASRGATPAAVAISGQLSAIVRIAGPAAVSCMVFSRKGDE